MNILSKIIGGGIAEPIEAVGNVIHKLFKSEEEKLTHMEVMARLAAKPREAQAEINKLEAQHRSIWVAGWRPGIGWVCAICLAFYFIPQFVVGTYLWAKMCLAAQALYPYPVDASQLFEIVVALLGLASLRTVEKFGNKTK